jgi:hypothetical protein
MSTQLTLRLAPDTTDGFVDATADVSCRGFGGHTRFTIARRDLDAFSRDVAALARGEADVAQLIGGWDAATERLRLSVTRAGTTSAFTARVRVADREPVADQWDRAETQFVCAGDALDAFVEALRVSGTGEARLSGDS